jgi:outer membrane protein, heavy metal efflux system
VRPADAALVLPGQLPEDRQIPVADDRLIAVGVEQNPELAGLAQQVAGRKDAVELAKMQFLPSINPTGAFTGSVSQSLGAMVMLPTTIPMINASIRESKAMLEASDAMLRQTRADRGASFVATLYALRSAERQEEFYRQTILPATRNLLTASRQDYVSGRVGLVELIDAQRTLLDVRRTAAQFHIEREKRLAELEELAGVDVETLAVRAATQATTAAVQAEPRSDEATKK